MSFILRFENLSERPACEVLQQVQEAPKRRLGELRIYDLLYDDVGPILRGVYLFYSADGICLYVGKNSSRTFVGRIPLHFSLAEGERITMNYLLRKIRKSDGLDSLRQAADVASDHVLLLIPVNERQLIGPLERFFRLFGNPKYNASQRKRPHQAIDLNQPLHDILRHL